MAEALIQEGSGYPCSDEDCSRSFDSETGRNVHIGRMHSDLHLLQCDYCNKEFQRKPSHISKNNFCCRGCKDEWKSDNVEGEDTNLWNGGKEVVFCDWCDLEFKRRPSHVRENNFCSRECFGSWQSENWVGIDNPAWSGGRGVYFSLLTVGLSESWESLSESIRKRFDRRCQVCGIEEEHLDRKLDVHHMVPICFGGTSFEENLIPLCQTCHSKAEDYVRDRIFTESIAEVE